MRFRVQDPTSVVVVRDSATPAPTPEPGGKDRPLDRLKEMARKGELFVIHSDDPLDLPLAIYANEPVPTDFSVDFEPEGGGFLLEVPSGRISISGYDAWRAGNHAGETNVAVPPGSYLILPHGRESVDAKRYAAERARLVGAREWAYYSRVSWLGLLGCLPMIVLGFSLLGKRWRLAMYVAVVMIVAWLPFLILSRTRRYRAVDEKVKAHDRALPVYLLEVRPVERSAGLVGGWITL